MFRYMLHVSIDVLFRPATATDLLKRAKVRKERARTTRSVMTEAQFLQIGRIFGSLRFPVEFHRIPRNFSLWKKFKATENRKQNTHKSIPVLYPMLRVLE